MFPSLGERQAIPHSDWTAFYERRVIVKYGSINPVPLCDLNKLGNTEIPRFWIQDSIIVLKWPRTGNVTGFPKSNRSPQCIRFESNSQLTRIESELFSFSKLQSISIPSNVEILGSKCFYFCTSL
jgi:hypothetical protein